MRIDNVCVKLMLHIGHFCKSCARRAPPIDVRSKLVYLNLIRVYAFVRLLFTIRRVLLQLLAHAREWHIQIGGREK